MSSELSNGVRADNDSHAVALSWISVSAWSLCAMFYCYQYAVRSAPPVMREHLTATWGADPLGRMISLYYVLYSFMALVAGTLLDRYGARRTIPYAALFVAACCLLISSGSQALGVFGFVAQAAGAIFGFIGAVYVAAKYLPPQNLSLFVGSAQMIGMAGAALGTKPVHAMIDPTSGPAWPWQHVWLLFAVIGTALAVGMWFLLPPDGATNSGGGSRFSLSALMRPYKVVFDNPQTYLCGLIGGLLFAPTTIGVLVWATEFLHQGRSVSLTEAATDASLVPIGWIIGCPLLGYVSDRIGRRKPVLLAGAAILLLALAAALYVNSSLAVRYVIALVIGISSGAAMIPFTVVKEVNPDDVKGSAAGAMNFLCFMVTGLLSPVFERTLRPTDGHVLALGGFQSALNPLIYGVGVAIVLSFFLRETGRNARQERDGSRTGALALEESGS